MCPRLIRCSPSNTRTVFHLGVNQKSKSHPDAPFRRSSNDEMEPTHDGEEALLAERSFTSPPTIFPHDVMKRIRQTRARVLHKHKHNDPLCTHCVHETLCASVHTHLLYNQPISSLYNLNTNLQLTQIICKHSHPATIHN